MNLFISLLYPSDQVYTILGKNVEEFLKIKIDKNFLHWNCWKLPSSVMINNECLCLQTIFIYWKLGQLEARSIIIGLNQLLKRVKINLYQRIIFSTGRLAFMKKVIKINKKFFL